MTACLDKAELLLTAGAVAVLAAQICLISYGFFEALAALGQR
jgi:hypothetical protein